MRFAWLRAHPAHPNDELDPMGQLIHALRAHHAIDVIHAAQAHDLLWRRRSHAFDLIVYELEDRPASQFIWPYLLRYPGLTLLLNSTLTASRTHALHAERRSEDLRRERAFDAKGVSAMLRAPLLASKLVAVPHVAVADVLASDYPGARIRSFVAGLSVPAVPRVSCDVVTVGSIAPDPRARASIEHAARRAREAGARFNLIVDADASRVLRESQIVVSLRWPSSGGLLPDARAALASGVALIVLDTLETADWPSLDPQSWQPRDVFESDAPVCVALDLRDEAHSLMLAIRRLVSDAELRTRLGQSARAWWRDHGSLDLAVVTFETLLEEARTIGCPERPPDWPPHLTADGTDAARAILSDFGLEVDVLGGTTR